MTEPLKASEITKETFAPPKPHPILATLPDYLKEPNNYDKIQRAILEAGATRHSHAEVVDWAGCKACQAKQIDRLMMMKKLGFQNAAQYMVWQKIHREIKARTLAANNKS